MLPARWNVVEDLFFPLFTRGSIPTFFQTGLLVLTVNTFAIGCILHSSRCNNNSHENAIAPPAPHKTMTSRRKSRQNNDSETTTTKVNINLSAETDRMTATVTNNYDSTRTTNASSSAQSPPRSGRNNDDSNDKSNMTSSAGLGTSNVDSVGNTNNNTNAEPITTRIRREFALRPTPSVKDVVAGGGRHHRRNKTDGDIIFAGGHRRVISETVFGAGWNLQWEQQSPTSTEKGIESEAAAAAVPNNSVRTTASAPPQHSPGYDWRKYAPNNYFRNPVKFFRWLMVGGMKYADKHTDDELADNLAALARCIVLLRMLLHRQHQQQQDEDDDNDKNSSHDNVHRVLHAISSNLYAGGAPLWAMEGVLKRVCHGLCGAVHSEWILLPRKAICGIFYSSGQSASYVFSYTKGYNVSLLDNIEPVTTRLASFASNSESVSGVPIRLPTLEQLNDATPTEEEIKEIQDELNEGMSDIDTNELRSLILDLSSQYDGLFNFVYTVERPVAQNSKDAYPVNKPHLDQFWTITKQERDLFSRLALEEANEMIREVQEENAKLLYPSWAFLMFETLSSWAACLIWFNGSWYDSIVSGLLAAVITNIRLSDVLSKQEKLLYEVVASFVVGIVAGLIVIRWPTETCFDAISISAVLSILQGFRIVQAVIQVMSKHTVAGAADLVEGIIFTGLIAISLKFGLDGALSIMRVEFSEDESYGVCASPIDKMWYFLIVPVAALAWSGSFNPHRGDLFGMACHGTLAFAINFVLDVVGATTNINLFVASMAVSFSSGIVSRFTGRQAVANTLAGIYVLVPGAYLAQNFFDGSGDGLAYTEVGVRGIVIGLGCWTGSVLCSPMVLGTTKALIQQSQESIRRSGSSGSLSRRSSESFPKKKDPFPTTMLSF